MRALRLLHGDMPDLCDARQRARQSARAHLPDQGHAGKRPSGRHGDRHPCRSLPVVPGLHDDLPVRGQLHAPGRSRPRAYRKDLSPAVDRSPDATPARHGAALSGAVSRRAVAGRPRPAVRRSFPSDRAVEAARRHAGARPGTRTEKIRLGVAGRARRARAAQGAGGAAFGLRAAGARSRHQRCGDPAFDAARHRGGGRRRRGVLRRAGAPYGSRGGRAGRGPA